MAERKGAPDVMKFDHQEYDVTCCLERICCGNTKLTMGEEEVELKNNVCFGMCKGVKRGPYGEMGTVDSQNFCCFIGFAASSLMADGQAQCTGCGCEEEKVSGIVDELKKRQQFRGDRAKVRMAEATLSSLQDLTSKVDLILDHLNLTSPETGTKVAATAEAMTR